MSTGKAQDRLEKLKTRLKTEKTTVSGRPEKSGVKSSVVKPRKKERSYQESSSDEKKKKIRELINLALTKPASSTQVKEAVKRSSAQVSVVTPLPPATVKNAAQSRLKRVTQNKKAETNPNQTKSNKCSTTQKSPTETEKPQFSAKFKIPKRAEQQECSKPPAPNPVEPPQNVQRYSRQPAQYSATPAWHSAQPVKTRQTAEANPNQTKSDQCGTTQKSSTETEKPQFSAKFKIPKRAEHQECSKPPAPNPVEPPQNVQRYSRQPAQYSATPAWHSAQPVPTRQTAEDKADPVAKASDPFLKPPKPLASPKTRNPPPEVQRNLFQRKTPASENSRNSGETSRNSTAKLQHSNCSGVEQKIRNRPYQRPQTKPKHDNGTSSKGLGWGDWVTKTCKGVVEAVKGTISYSIGCPNVTKQLQNVRALVEPVEMMDYEISCPLFESELAPIDQTDLHIVIDTNVVLDDLDLIRSLKMRKVKGLTPKIIIPWQVLKELDYLKENKHKFDSMHTNVNARKGIRFLLDEIVHGNGYIGGQPQHIASRNSIDFVVEVPDDHLIKCCLQLKWAGHNVLLLTNDKNLVIKAVVSEVSSMRCDEFSKILHESRDNEYWPVSCFEMPPSGTFTGHKLNDVNATHRVIILLRGFLSAILKKFWIYKYQDLWKLRSPGQEPRSLTSLLEIAYESWNEITCGQSQSSSEVILFLRRFINKMNYERLEYQDLDHLGRACYQLANSLPSSFGIEGITFDHSLAFLKCTEDSGPPADATFPDSCVALTVHHFQLFENKAVQYCYGISQNHGIPFHYPKIPPGYQSVVNINDANSHIRVVSDIGRALVRISASQLGEISKASEAAQMIHSTLMMYLGDAADHRFVLQDVVEFCNSANMRKSFTSALENLQTISAFLQPFNQR